MPRALAGAGNSSLASWESMFGLGRLADAASVPTVFGADIFTATHK
jgi:hypothetical protein